MKEMVGGCCVCSDDRGWAENPLVYCDGQGCTVAVHQACYGIVTVPTGNWYCRKCESQERAVKVKCELCPSRDGALKPTDNNGWAHVVCALYIPEVRFGNVTTMEPIILHQIPQERFAKSCYICEESNKGSRATVGACMQCNKVGCRQQFHVTCAQSLGLLCEEAGNYLDNVKYCGYCHHHYTKLKKGGNVKPIPPYRPVGNDSPDASPTKEIDTLKTTSKRKLRGGKTPPTAQASPDPSGSPRPLTPSAKLSSSSSSSSSSATTNPSLATVAAVAVAPQLVTLHQQQQQLAPTSAVPPQQPPQGIAQPPSSVGVAPVAHPHPSSVTNPSPPGGTKPSSIVVQVPLEAAMVGGGGGGGVAGGPAPPPPPPPPPPPTLASVTNSTNSATVPSPPVPDQPDIPAKRARSQSSEKSEKGRRSKRTSGSSSSSAGSGSTVVNNSVGSVMASVTTNSVKPQVGSGPSILPTMPPSAIVHPTPVVHQQSPAILTNSTMGIKGMSAGNDPLNEVQMSSSSSSSHKSRKAVIKEEKDIKIFQNGVSTAPHMLGNQLNPSSTMAQKMCDTLSQEVAAHSIFSTEPNLSSSSNLVGPHLPKPASSRAGISSSSSTPGSSSNGVNWNHCIPQSLDQLLERQWEQGSQFLMEQAQHFDIASLLSCLHQLRAENAQLEEHVNSLLARRDHLLAVNARLAIPLVPPSTGGSSGGSGAARHQGGGGGGGAQGAATATVAPHVVENGMASQAEQQYMHRSSSASNQQSVRSVQGGSGQSSVVVRASSSSSSPGTAVVPPTASVTSSVVVPPPQQQPQQPQQQQSTTQHPPDQHRRL